MVNVSKAHVLKCAAYNLGLLLRKVFGMSKPRNRDQATAVLFGAILSLAVLTSVMASCRASALPNWFWQLSMLLAIAARIIWVRSQPLPLKKITHFLTGC